MAASNSTLFQPIFFSLREQIAERIRTDVMCGHLPEGERLNEIELGEQFGVSRTPIREALQQLMHEGLLEGRPNTGVKVAARPADAICDFIVIIRRMVEIFALRIFFAELTENDFAHWQTILERMREACVAKDYKAIAKHDIDFHRSIVRRARQRDLEAIWTSLVGRVRSHFKETQQRNYASALDIYEEHVKIIEAFRGGDVQKAVATLEERIN
jgi:DNA-binding GntR family transcriptional regulator